MSWIRYQAEETAKLLNKVTTENEVKRRKGEAVAEDVCPIDTLPIWVNDLTLIHLHTASCEVFPPNDIQPNLVLNGYVELQQGRLISLIGPHSGGKTALLKVLGGSLLPDMEIHKGQVFMPCHLRVIHITSEASFFRGSLMDNVTYGCRRGDPDSDKARVKAIFRLLGLPGNVINLLEDDSLHFSNWLDVLSVSQKHLLSIVRALIANPQVICIHKPTDKYSDEKGKQVLAVLKNFTQGAGLAQDENVVSLKKPRPRTCIMTNVNLFARDYADDIIFVSRQYLKRIDPKDVREDMLGV